MISGLDQDQFRKLRDLMSCTEMGFGYGRLGESSLSRMRQGKKCVLVSDEKHIKRPVLNKRQIPFKTVQDVRAAFERRSMVGYRGYVVKRQPLLGKRGDFPTGLLPIAERFLKSLPHVIDDRRAIPAGHPDLFSLDLPLTPYPEQTEAVSTAIEQERGIIHACTGFGKSITMACLVAALKVRTLIVVPNLTLKNQLRATFTELFGSLDNITIENVDSPALQKDGKYDLLIVDEAHHSACVTIRKLNRKMWNGIYYRFFFTGTPFRSREAEQIIMESVTGKVIYSVPYLKARDKGYVCPVECYYYTLPKQEVTDPRSWQSVYSELVVNNAYRNELIASLLKNLHASGQSTLCIVKEIKHGQALQCLTGAAFAHGEAEDTDELLPWFAEGKLTSLIATAGVAGEGTDTKACSWVILAAAGKSRPAFIQQVGRGTRVFPGKDVCRVVLFRDESSDYLLGHFNEQCRYMLEEFGVEPTELPLPEDLPLPAAPEPAAKRRRKVA